jgi:hypothetical protein
MMRVALSCVCAALCVLIQLVLGADMGQRLRQVHSCIRRLMDTAAALLAHCSDSEPGRPYVQQVRLFFLQSGGPQPFVNWAQQPAIICQGPKQLRKAGLTHPVSGGAQCPDQICMEFDCFTLRSSCCAAAATQPSHHKTFPPYTLAQSMCYSRHPLL